MKKLLNISVIAALAILPLAANAADIDKDPGATTANAPEAQNAPKYALATAADTDETNVATASYVKGAYNAAIKAINKVATTADSAVKTVKVNGTALTPTDGAVDVLVGESTTNGAIKVNNQDVAVHGLGSAAYTESTDYISSTAGSVKTANIDNGQVTKEKLATAVQESLEGAVQDVSEGTTNGTVSVDGTDVAVHGLKSAAYAETTAFDAAGAATAVETKLTTGGGATGYDINAKTLKVQGADVLTNAALTDYAKKTGVTQTITNSTIAGTVPTVTTWGTETTGTAQITASITGATYAEPANP
jgi:hypothetical protein